MLKVIYLVYNEGYSASTGDQLLRTDLSSEAIRLGRQLLELLPEPEAEGLLALMLLQDSRRNTRTDAHGDLVLLEDQDRSRWDHEQIAEGVQRVEQALQSRRFGPYTLQAATDWAQIVALYEVLNRISPSPVVQLNQAIAVAMADGPATGLQRLDALAESGSLANYHLLPAARADLLRRLQRHDEALAAYRTALEMVSQGPERRFLERRIRELEAH